MNYLSNNSVKLNRRAHIKYFLRHLGGLPQYYSKLDSTRLVFIFFAVSGLDVLDSLDSLTDQRKKEIINWIYDLQVVNDQELVSGFQATTILNSLENKHHNSPYKWGHIANTYSALCSLLALGDDLSRIQRKSIVKSLRILQDESGCFSAAKEGTESDMRFVYCAACICYILDDWSGMDMNKTIAFIRRSLSYDHGMGQGPELESHGGPTFCAIATLVLLNRLDVLTEAEIEGLIRWLIFRQVDGFQGRPNKPVDTCYSFWIGATLKMLQVLHLINDQQNYQYVMSTQDSVVGGFSKWVDSQSDPLHSYLALCSLSLMNKDNLCDLVPTLNISQKAFDHLKVIQDNWRSDKNL